MKKRLSLLLATMMFASAGTAFAYTDVDGLSSEVQAAIDNMAENNIMTGYEDGTFAPEGVITRAEFAKVAVAAYNVKNPGISATNSTYSYSDLVDGAWYTSDISNATALGLMQGDTEGTFRPNDAVSETEVVTVLLRALGYDNLNGEWPVVYLEKAQELGLIEGYEISADDGSNENVVGASYGANRGTVAVLVDKMLNLESQVVAPEVEEYTEVFGKYGYVYNVVGDQISIKGFDGTNVTYTLGDDVSKPEEGAMVFFFADDAKVISEIKTEEVVEETAMSATIDGNKIKFSAGTFEVADDAKVLDVNGSGASIVDIDDVMAGDYISAIRSTSTYANIQYVLVDGMVEYLIVGSYANSSDTMFAYAENFGTVANGETEVTFYGVDGSFTWDDDVEKREGALYAYTLNGNVAEAYLVGVAGATSSAKFAFGEVSYLGDINGLDDGSNFVVGDDTVILRVTLENGDHTSADFESWEVTDVEYATKVKKGEDIVVRYTETSGVVDIEAAFIIIVD